MDYLGLVTAPLSTSLAGAVTTLLREARHRDPADLHVQTHLPGRANTVVRALLDSARCPTDLAAQHGLDADASAGRLLKRMLWMGFDAERADSVHTQQALLLCRSALDVGESNDALRLWRRLRDISTALRTSGGEMDLPGLLRAIRGEFSLSGHPDYRADWRRLSDDARVWIDRVQTTIGATVELAREREREAIRTALDHTSAVVLVGESGIGKTGIVKAEAATVLSSGPVVWADVRRLDGWTLTDWRSGLVLDHPLAELAAAVPQSCALLVLDSLDRLYSSEAFDAVAELVRATQIGGDTSPWRLLTSCTPEAWDRVQRELASRQVSLATAHVIEVEAPAAEELAAVWEAFPELAILKDREHIAPILRPKVLDLLATNHSVLGDATLFGESDVARIFWNHEVAPATKSIGRAHAARHLATLLADRLRPALPESSLFDALDRVSPDTLDALERDRVLVRVGGAVAFAHDLYADWVRAGTLRHEADEGTLATFLAPRAASPVWQRALRLFGIDLLEQEGDRGAWRRVYDALQGAAIIDDQNRPLLGDALLEALAFSVKSGIGLLRDDVWPLLAQEGGHLLRRLLRRLRVSATVTDRALVRAVSKVTGDPDAAQAVAQVARVPFWQYWYGILSLLHRHRHEIPQQAAGDAAEALSIWLRQTAPAFPFRAEAALVAVALGDALLKDKEAHGDLYGDGELDQAVYRAVLSAGREEPDAAVQILLEAAGRRTHRFAPPPPSEEERGARRGTQHFPPSLGRSGPMIGPFPHGPTARADGALQKVVWSVDGLRPLCEALPDVARELLLATLISAPHQASYHNDLYGEYGLEWPSSWHPTFYTHGPFLSFLRTDEAHAVTAVLQLLQHATEQWVDNAERAARERGLVGPVYVPTVDVWVEGDWKPFVGDGSVFSWDVSGPGHGNTISVALQAVEQYLYDRLDSGVDVSCLLKRLLRDGWSLAILGVLSSVLQRHPDLADGPLRGLGVSPEIALMVQKRAEAAQSYMGQWLWWTGLTQLPSYLHAAYEAWHTMLHRTSPVVVPPPVLATLVVLRPDLAPFVDQAHEWLRARLGDGGRYQGWQEAERIAEMLDRSNYHPAAGPDGAPAVEFRAPEEWARRQQEVQLAEVQEEFVDNLPALAAAAYGHLGSQEADVDGYLNTVAPDAPDDAWAGRPEIEIARAALCLHPTMGSRSANRLAWARQRVLDASESPDPTPGLYSFVGNMLRTPVVLPRAAVALLVRDPSDQAARTAVARHLRVSPLHDLAALADAARVFASDLEEDLARVARALMERSEVDRRLSSAEQNLRMAEIRSDESDAENWQAQATEARRDLQRIEDGFVGGALSPTLPDLDNLAPLRPPRPATDARRRPRPHRPVNADLLAISLVAYPTGAPVGSLWYDALGRFAAETFGSLAPPASQEHTGIDGLPDGWQHGLLERLGAETSVSADPNAAEALWRPVLDLGAMPRGWVDVFASEFTRRVVVPNPDPVSLETWRRMIRYALGHPAWAPGPPGGHAAYDSEQTWRSLLGLSSVVNVRDWTSELRPAFDAIKTEMLTWVSDHLGSSESVGWLAGVFVHEAFEDFEVAGLIRLAAVAVEHPDAFWGRSRSRASVEPHVTELLSHVWLHRRADLRSRPDVAQAFHVLLRTLVAKQHPAAIHLAEEVRKEGL